MLPSMKYIPLLIAVASAQSVEILSNLFIEEGQTLTLQGADQTASTYVYTCTPSSSASSTLAPALSPTTNFPTTIPTELPSTTQEVFRLTGLPKISDRIPFPWELAWRCPTYTIIQGPSTHSFHLNMATSSIPFENDVQCTWTGAWRDANITCTATTSMPLITMTPMTTGSVESYYFQQGENSVTGGVEVDTVTLSKEPPSRTFNVELMAVVTAEGYTGPTSAAPKEQETETGTKTSSGLGARATGDNFLRMGGGLVGVLGVGVGVFF